MLSCKYLLPNLRKILEPSLLDIIEELKKFTAAELLNEVCTLFKLILVMPATNAVSDDHLVHFVASKHTSDLP